MHLYSCSLSVLNNLHQKLHSNCAFRTTCLKDQIHHSFGFSTPNQSNMQNVSVDSRRHSRRAPIHSQNELRSERPKQSIAFELFAKNRMNSLRGVERKLGATVLNGKFLMEWKDLTTKEKKLYLDEEKRIMNHDDTMFQCSSRSETITEQKIDQPLTVITHYENAAPHVTECENAIETYSPLEISLKVSFDLPNSPIVHEETKKASRSYRKNKGVQERSSVRFKTPTAFNIFAEERFNSLSDSKKKSSAKLLNASFLAEWKDLPYAEKKMFFDKEKQLKYICNKPQLSQTEMDELFGLGGAEEQNFEESLFNDLREIEEDESASQFSDLLHNDILPEDLIDCNPTLHFPDDYPWAEVFDSIGINHFEF